MDGNMRVAHMYNTEEVRQHAINLGRIPSSQAQPSQSADGLRFKSISVAQAIALLPGCKTLKRRFTPWIWHAIVRYYGQLDSSVFTEGPLRKDTARQLKAAVGQLNTMYACWPSAKRPPTRRRSLSRPFRPCLRGLQG